MAALRENDLANRYPPMPSLTTTLGGTIAAVCFRCQSQRNYEFAMDRLGEAIGAQTAPLAELSRAGSGGETSLPAATGAHSTAGMGQSREGTPSNSNLLAAFHSGLEQAHEVGGGP